MMTSRGVAFYGAIALSVVCGAAHASVSQFYFDATITDSSPNFLSTGTNFTGTFSYDPSTIPTYIIPSEAQWVNLPSSNISLTVGGHALSGSIYMIQVWGSGSANFQSLYTTNNGAFDQYAQIYLVTNIASGATTLPTTFIQPDAGTAQRTSSFLLSNSDGGVVGAKFVINSITPAVPELSTYFMSMIGIAFFGGVARRHRVSRAV